MLIKRDLLVLFLAVFLIGTVYAVSYCRELPEAECPDGTGNNPNLLSGIRNIPEQNLPEEQKNILNQFVQYMDKNFPENYIECNTSINASAAGQSKEANCQFIFECACVWDEGVCKGKRWWREEPEGCVSASSQLKQFLGQSCTTLINPIAGSCTPENNKMNLIWVSSGTEAGCLSGSKELPCPSTNTLNFFGWFNFFACGLAIMLIYLSKKSDI